MALTDLSQGVCGGSGIGINDLIDAEKVEYKTISLTDVGNGYVTFSSAVGASGNLRVTTMEGTVLQFGVDYIVDSGNRRVVWTGFGLDGKIASGDVLQLVYFTTA